MAARIIPRVRTREAAAAARVTLAVTGDASAGEVAAETEATAGKAARTTVWARARGVGRPARTAAARVTTVGPVGATEEAATGPTSAFRGGGLVLRRALVWPRKDPATREICWRRASLPASVVASLKRLQHWRRVCAREAKADGTWKRQRGNQGTKKKKKHLPDHKGTSAPYSIGTLWSPDRRMSKTRRGRCRHGQRTANKGPETAQRRPREEAGVAGGPRGAVEYLEGSVARQATGRAKQREEYRGGEAHGRACDGEGVRTSCTGKERKSLGESEKGDIYTNHVTRSDRETEATGTSKRMTSLRQPRSVNRSE
jgi:hypothetical protein